MSESSSGGRRDRFFSATGISDGIVTGPIRFRKEGTAQVIGRAHGDAAEELGRAERARKALLSYYEEEEKRARSAGMKEQAGIYLSRQMILEDEGLRKFRDSLMELQRYSAEYAVQEAFAYAAWAISRSGDRLLYDRQKDILDVGKEYLARLRSTEEGKNAGAGTETGKKTDAPQHEKYILAARDLLPSEILQLPREELLGVILKEGSFDSHAAILIRSFGIPAVVRCEELSGLWDGQEVSLDAEAGRVYLRPDEQLKMQLRKKEEKRRETERILDEYRDRESVTSDGKKILLLANIGDPAELRITIRNGADGIGLFRTEFLFLDSEEEPSEETQFAVYREIAAAMAGRPVVIRTFDIGSDKSAEYLHMEPESNPALGLRGIRVSLMHTAFFKKQLRAALRAAAYGDIRILLPMISDPEEVRVSRDILRECRSELMQEGKNAGEVQLGVMIETPAAVLCAEELAKLADFFSIGTNDLLQYTCAMDRQNPTLRPFVRPCHPALMREIRMTVEAGHAAGIPVSICGEIASDEKQTPAFLAMGVDSLSVTPRRILPLRRAVCEL